MLCAWSGQVEGSDSQLLLNSFPVFFLDTVSSNCFDSPAPAQHFCAHLESQKMPVSAVPGCLGAKLTCTSSRSQCYSRQVGAVEKQAVFVLTAAGSLSLATRQGETRAVAFSAASTICSVLIRECWYHVVTFLWVSSCVWIKDFFLERNTRNTTFFTKVIGLPVMHTV